jgi:hypothetical protein
VPKKKKKDLYYGTKKVRMSVSDRTSKTARPWNHPLVVKASTAYGVPFNSYKQVHSYENTLEDMKSLDSESRFTCRPCGKFTAEHEDGQCNV